MRESSSERRTHPRYSTSLQLQATVEEGGTVARMQARNLSLGGLYCVTQQDIPEMMRLGVRLMLPVLEGEGHEPLDIEAVVVRRRPLPSINGDARFELGLFFTSVPGEVRERLANYLETVGQPIGH